MTTLIRGACPHDCPDTCATITEVQDGRALAFYADNEHPMTRGWLCAKVRPYLERVYDPDRLAYPIRRIGPKCAGAWRRISWEEAIEEITQRWKAIIREYGAAAILPYSYSGTLGLVQNAVSSSRLWNRMGVSGLQRSICGAAAETVVEMTLGARWGIDPGDIVHSKLIILWGHNPASTGPHLMPVLRAAQKNGAFVVVIDPRRTLTARSANLHLQPRPATDAALALGLLHVIFAEELHDEAWLEAHSLGWRELRERAADFPPQRVAELCGLPADTIISLARRYASTKPALIKFADGLQRHGNGGQTVRALCCLPAVTGQYGKLGGGLAYSTSGYVKWNSTALGHASECEPSPRTINMNRLGAALTGEVHDPPIKSLYVFAANPVTSAPNAGKIVEGLLREDVFTVVHEQFLTDTAHYADIVLPATTQLEQSDLHKAYGHRNLQYNQAAIAPLAEAKSNWDVMRLLAAGMGYTEPWLQESAEEAMRSILDASRAENPYLQGITFERLQAEATVPLHFTEETRIPFADGHFPTPSGKVELLCAAMQAQGLDPLPDYCVPQEFSQLVGAEDQHSEHKQQAALTLISAAAHHFVSSTFGNQGSLRTKEGEPWIEIHPADAAERGIQHGDLVMVGNNRGACQLQAILSEDVPIGVAVAPKGHWASRSPDGRNINWTTSDALADIAGQSTFHSNRVFVKPKC